MLAGETPRHYMPVIFLILLSTLTAGPQQWAG
jgi:hypothetical protein